MTSVRTWIIGFFSNYENLSAQVFIISLTLKKKPGVSDRDIRGVIDGGSYMSEARFWSDVLCCVADGRWNMVAVFTSW